MEIAQAKSFEIFRDMEDDEIKRFCERGTQITIPAGEQFITEGEVGDSIYLLTAGEVEVTKALTLPLSKGRIDNREKAMIRITSDMYPLFGEMSLFDDGDRRTANVKAITECELVKITKEDLFEICENDPGIGYKLMRNLGRIITRNLVKANQDVLKLTTAFSLILER
jgi:CRP-like cAMP-binding protein